jgi:hypothetical protein
LLGGRSYDGEARRSKTAEQVIAAKQMIATTAERGCRTASSVERSIPGHAMAGLLPPV